MWYNPTTCFLYFDKNFTAYYALKIKIHRFSHKSSIFFIIVTCVSQNVKALIFINKKTLDLHNTFMKM